MTMMEKIKAADAMECYRLVDGDVPLNNEEMEAAIRKIIADDMNILRIAMTDKEGAVALLMTAILMLKQGKDIL